MTRSFLRAVARSLVGGLLMAQMAIAAYACPSLSAAVAAVAAGTLQMPAPSASPDERGLVEVGMPMAQSNNCHDMAGAMDVSSPNLCAEYCKYGQQSDKTPTLSAPTAVLTALYATPLVPDPAALPARSAAATLSALVAAAPPPHTVLHCVYRI